MTPRSMRCSLLRGAAREGERWGRTQPVHHLGYRGVSPLLRRRRLCRRPSEAWQESSSFQRPSPDCVGPTLARLAGSVKRFVSLRPTSRLSPPPRSAPPFLECSSSLSQTALPSTSLLPDGSLAPVLSEELSCDVPCWRSS